MPNYLLDVNVLVAHAILEHEHHDAVVLGLKQAKKRGCRLYICPIAELGLVRNAMRIASLSLIEAQVLLANEYINLELEFVPASAQVADLPTWVQGHRQTTDAYLDTLAKSHGLTLATTDKGIPGADCLI